MALSPQEAWRQLEKRHPNTAASWSAAPHIVGALMGWRALTHDQLVALSGTESILNSHGPVFGSLFASGVVRGHRDKEQREQWARAGHSPQRRAFDAYSLGERHLVERYVKLLDQTLFEHLRVNAGLPMTSATLHLRHDILAAELGLRCMEFGAAKALLGPRFCRFGLLHSRTPSTQDGSNLPHPAESQTAGPDLMLILDNHYRVCIEVTASIGENFTAKLGRCVEFLHSEAGREAPTSIVFVVAARSNDIDNARIDHGTQAKLVKQLNALADEHSLGRGALKHIYLASWADWFPRPDMVNWDAFTELRVRRASDSQVVALNGRSVASNEQAELTHFTALSASLLYQSPRWTWPANQDAFNLRVKDLGTTLVRPGNLDLDVWYTYFREIYGN